MYILYCISDGYNSVKKLVCCFSNRNGMMAVIVMVMGDARQDVENVT